MKNKKILAILTISAIVSAAATGCSFGGDEPEEQVVVTETPAPEATATPTPEPTIAPDVQDSTYTSSNGDVSIKLPDAPGPIRRMRQICSASNPRSRVRS